MHGSCTSERARCTDEPLIRQVQQQGEDSVAARNQLIERFLTDAQRVARQVGARWTWIARPDVIEDVEQEAVFGLLEAVCCYDCQKSSAPSGQAFRRFLRRVVASRTIDYFRRQQRQYLWDRRWACRASALPVPPDPAVCAQQAELYQCLLKAIEQLGDQERRLCKLLADGERLHSIAVKLHVSYGVAKRRRRRLPCTLRNALKGFK